MKFIFKAVAAPVLAGMIVGTVAMRTLPLVGVEGRAEGSVLNPAEEIGASFAAMVAAGVTGYALRGTRKPAVSAPQ
jgi:hypothetical protein